MKHTLVPDGNYGLKCTQCDLRWFGFSEADITRLDPDCYPRQTVKVFGQPMTIVTRPDIPAGTVVIRPEPDPMKRLIRTRVLDRKGDRLLKALGFETEGDTDETPPSA